MLLQKTANGFEHGLLNTLVNRVPKSKRFKNVEPKKRAELEKKILDDSELENVRYINYKNQTSGTRSVDWTAGAGCPYFLFRFLHGHTYKIPKGVVNVVNSPMGKLKHREGSIDENGKPREKDEDSYRIDEFVRDF